MQCVHVHGVLAHAHAQMCIELLVFGVAIAHSAARAKSQSLVYRTLFHHSAGQTSLQWFAWVLLPTVSTCPFPPHVKILVDF